jgi:hypothetical protein
MLTGSRYSLTPRRRAGLSLFSPVPKIQCERKRMVNFIGDIIDGTGEK